MSAYLVDPERIQVLARYAFEPCQYGSTHDNVLTSSIERIAEVLALENIKSVRARYNGSAAYSFADDCEFFSDMTYGDYVRECKQETPLRPSDKGIFDLVREYDYQACEHPDYYHSLAFMVLNQIVWRIARNCYPAG